MEKIKKALKTTEFGARILFMTAPVCLCALFVLMFSDVSGRFLFNSPIVGTQEIADYLLIAVAFLGLGYGQLRGQHISVDILTMHFPKKLRAVLNIILQLLAVAFFVIMTLQTGQRAYKDWLEKVLLPDTTVKLPIFGMSLLASIGCALLAIVMLVGIIERIIKLMQSESAT